MVWLSDTGRQAAFKQLSGIPPHPRVRSVAASRVWECASRSLALILQQRNVMKAERD